MSRHSASEYRSCRVPPSKATGSHHTRDCPRPTDQLTKLLTSWLVVAQQCFEAEALFPTGMLWYVPDRNAHKCVCFRVCVCVFRISQVRSLAWEDPGEGHGSPLLYSYQDNTMDRGARRATVHGVTYSWTRLSDRARLHI